MLRRRPCRIDRANFFLRVRDALRFAARNILRPRPAPAASNLQIARIARGRYLQWGERPREPAHRQPRPTQMTHYPIFYRRKIR
jgi:hypothetical protein